MKKVIQFFIENHKLTIVLSFMLIMFGFLGLANINAESFPAVDFAMATIETRYDGATPEDIETKITKPIEDKIKRVSGLKDVRSVSMSGLSKIFVRVDMDNEVVDDVMNDLQKEVNSVSDLPMDLRDDPVFTEIDSEEFPAIEVAITGSNVNRHRDLVSDRLKEELEDNKKISTVRMVGFRKRQFNIRLDINKMDNEHIGISEVIQKIQERNVNIPGGELIQDDLNQLIRVEGKISNAKELENIGIRTNFNGKTILLKDIARVEDSMEDAVVLAGHNGKPATLLIVNKKGGADTLKLVEEVDKIIHKYQEKYKDDLNIYVYHNEAQNVKSKLEILSSNAVSGLILVIVFLFLFLPGRIGLMASMSLPLAVMGTLGFMHYLGFNLNSITILALVIALGMLVDNAVVISENFTRLRQEGLSVLDACVTSVNQIWLPITCTAMTTIAAFLPMLVTKGIMGEFIKAIPIIVSISLVLSLLESFFFLPMRLKFVGKSVKKETEESKKDWFHRFIKKFEGMMDWCVSHRYIVFFIFFMTLVGSILLMSIGNKFILFPAEQTEIYMGRVEMPRGTNIDKTERVVEELTLKIRSELGDWQKDVIGRAGSSKADPTDPKGSEGDSQGLVIIYASDFAKFNIDYQVFLKKLRNVTHDEAKLVTFEEQINGPPVGDPINATFRSNTTENLEGMISEVKEELAQVKGVRDLEIDDVIGEDQVFVKIDYTKADQLGLSVSDIGNALRTALSGTMVSKVTLDNKEVDLNVRFLDTYRKNEADLTKVKIMDRLGNLIPISTVASFKTAQGSVEIKRFDFKRAKTLTGKVEESLITSPEANQKLREIFNKKLDKYNDVTLVFGGQEESTKESMQSLGEALILALMGIFALLVFLFRSYLRPVIIMSTIPLGLVGVSLSFFLHNKPISFLAMIGVIGLAGIIVNSGIVLISFIDDMRVEGDLNLHDILVKASGMRLRAVLVTSLTTISGLIPTAYGIGGEDAMLIPMTLAMAWGLTSGTFLTLIWVPCAYAILEDLNSFLAKLPVMNRFYGQSDLQMEAKGS